MKISLIIPNLKKRILNLADFQYSLGYFEIVNGKTTVSFFKNKKCMVFLTISDLYHVIEELEKDNSKELQWVGEDNGYSFRIVIQRESICFYGNDFNIEFMLKKLKKSLDKALKKTLIKMAKHNPEITEERYFLDLKSLLMKN